MTSVTQAVKQALVARWERSVCHLDVETYSTCNLKSAGVYRYAEHESTELLVLSYAFDDEPVRLWIPAASIPSQIHYGLVAAKSGFNGRVINVSLDVPDDLRQHIESGGEIRAHNALFERTVLNGTAGRKVNFPGIKAEQCVCTAAKMAANGLPRALGDAAKALKSQHEKSTEGRITMLQLSQPRRGKESRYTPENSPDKFLILYSYNIDDVEAERAIDKMVPDLTPSEQKVYQLDQKINDRGILVDLEAIHNILAVIEEYKGYLAVEMEKATSSFLDAGLKPTQRDKIAEWVRANGFPQLCDMQAETVKEIIAGDKAPDNVKRVLQIYSTYNMKAVTKYQAMLDAVCSDGRLRGMFLYHGANTGRWSSLIVQLQNLFRPVIKDPDVAIEAFKARSLDWIRTLYEGVDPMRVAASCIRGMLIASPGKDLLFPDFAGIESRVNAWFFGEEWKLQVFRDYDTILGVDEKGEPIRKGPDAYKVAYARSFNCLPEDVTKDQRQIGKVQELALGYEGGVGAFTTMVDTYGIDLDELAEKAYSTLPDNARESAEWMWEKFGQATGLSHDVYVTCDGLKYLWRQAHPKIKDGWKDLKVAAEQAVQFPGKIFAIPNQKIMFKVVKFGENSWLKMRLPSGRQLSYFNPRWIPPKVVKGKDRYGNDVEKEIPGELRYWGIDTKTRQWKEVSSYGGKWDENADQGFSRDLLVAGMFAMEENGYPVIGSVHDEGITEPDEDYGTFEHAGQLMCDAAGKVAPGLPLAVDGHRAKRYRK